MIILHLESFENNLSNQISRYKKTFFHAYEIFFFEILSPFHTSKHFWKYQTLFLKTIRYEAK